MAEPSAPPGYRLRVGLKAGEPHTRKGINRQDHVDKRVFALGGKTYSVAFLADGCSGENPKRSHTEVGAKLLVQKALTETRLLLTSGVPLERLSAPLYQRLIVFLQTIAQATFPGLTGEQEYLDFIGDYLMSTLLGVVTDGEMILTLRSADGVEIVNEKINIVHDKAPIYLAYHVLNPAQMASVCRKAECEITLPQDFDTTLYAADSVERLALCTDGIAQRAADRTEFIADADLTGIFDYDTDAPAGLQWFLNKRALAQPFDDDVAAITLTRIRL